MELEDHLLDLLDLETKQFDQAHEDLTCPTDPVNRPKHYVNGKVECIDAIEAALGPAEFIGYLRGNVFKYLWRYKLKNGLEDLNKANWYLKKLRAFPGKTTMGVK